MPADIDAAIVEAANRGMDEAFAGLYELFKDQPGRPHPAFVRYDIVIENGEVKWVPNEVDRMVDEAYRELFGDHLI